MLTLTPDQDWALGYCSLLRYYQARDENRTYEMGPILLLGLWTWSCGSTFEGYIHYTIIPTFYVISLSDLVQVEPNNRELGVELEWLLEL